MFRRARATALLLLSLAGRTSAQLGPLDYSTNWAPMHDAPAVAFTARSLFAPLTGPLQAVTAGNAIRRCYGIDSGQGGRNQSAARIESTWFRMLQGWGQGAPAPGLTVGLVSIQAAAAGDAAADACFAPFFQTQQGPTQSALGAAVVLGLVSGTAGGPFPTVWDVAFQWLGTGAGFQGVHVPATLGRDAQASCPEQPLLSNLIYEIQTPTGSGPGSTYYMASTTERIGTSPLGSGGVTNGNNAMGSALFGAPAEASNCVSHTRLLSSHVSGTLVGAPMLTLHGRVGSTELAGHLAFQTPSLWSINAGSEGAGGSDWVVSRVPVSTVNLRMLDCLAGGQTSSAILTPFGTLSPAAAYDSSIILNVAVFLWSATSAASLSQAPTSWDDLGGTLCPASPGSATLGAVATFREGEQLLPVATDLLTSAVLQSSALTVGKSFANMGDPFLDGFSATSQGMTSPIFSGTSTLSGGATPAVGTPQPALEGQKLGIAALGLQLKTAPQAHLLVTEVASALEINLQ